MRYPKAGCSLVLAVLVEDADGSVPAAVGLGVLLGLNTTVMGTGDAEGGVAPKTFQMGFVKLHPKKMVDGQRDLANKHNIFKPKPTPTVGSITF